MHSFEGARNFNINSIVQVEHQTQYNTAGMNGFEILQKYVAASAMHDSMERCDPPKCHPRTREAVQNEIVRWIKNNSVEDKKLMWIYAPAGAGKSAIAQSVAERDDMEGTLCGFFAFSRSSSGRDTVNPLVPTLAYQLALHVPGTQIHIMKAVEKDPQIFSRSVESQMRYLIFGPFLHAGNDGGSQLQSKSMIIDGLDECKDPQIQSLIIQSIVKNLSRSSTRIRFLIFSRPELEIRNTFNKIDISQCCVHLELDEKFKPDLDIELFLRDKFEEIKQIHPYLKTQNCQWPTDDNIMYLVGKSSGQFIYPATVIRYINNPRSNPENQLKVILDVRPSVPSNNPFAELDALYMFILDQIQHPHADILHIFMVIAWAKTENVVKSANFITNFLMLEDIHMLIADLHSIVKIPKEESDISISFYHASFIDFLTDKTRSGIFYINETDANGYLAKKCFTHLGPSWSTDKYNIKAYSQLYSFYHIMGSDEHCVYSIEDEFGSNFIIEKLRYVISAKSRGGKFPGFTSYLFIGNAIVLIFMQNREGPPDTVDNIFFDNFACPIDYDCTMYFELSLDIGRCFGIGAETTEMMRNIMHSWLAHLYDDEGEWREEFDCKLVTYVPVKDGEAPDKYKFTSDCSVCLLYIVEWLSDILGINILVDVYFHILRLLFTKQASPSKLLGVRLRGQEMDLMNAFRRFNLQESRIEKLQSYMDDFLQKCNNAEDGDFPFEDISWIGFTDSDGEEYTDEDYAEDDGELDGVDEKYIGDKSEANDIELASRTPFLVEEGHDNISQHVGESVSRRNLRGSGSPVEEWQSGQSESQSYVNAVLPVSNNSYSPSASVHAFSIDTTQTFSTLDLPQIDPWGIHNNEESVTSDTLTGNLTTTDMSTVYSDWESIMNNLRSENFDEVNNEQGQGIRKRRRSQQSYSSGTGSPETSKPRYSY